MRTLLCLVEWVSLSLGLGLVSARAHAAPVKSLDFTIHQEYTSTRAMGMGNAFTAVADDHSSLFYNPATLANRTSSQVRMFLRGGTGTNSLKLFDQIKAVKKLPEGDAQTKGYFDLIESHYGDHFYFRAPTIGLVWVWKNWGFAFIPADLSLDIGVHRQVGPMLNVNLYLDSTLALGYAHKLDWFKDHKLSWGTTLKSIHRIYVGQAISAGELSTGQSVFSTSNANEGLTGDIDLGTYWSPPVPGGFMSFLKYMKPSFAMVGRNLVDYGFKTNFHMVSKLSGQPPDLERRLDLGSKWDLPKWWVFDPHFSADVRDIGHPNWTYRKGSHLGLELYWKMYNWWKGHWAGGFNQGYWTAGFGARLAWFQIDLASFGEEVGTDATRREDRRYLIELALDF